MAGMLVACLGGIDVDGGAGPFASLATYTTWLSRFANAQHVSVGEALRQYGGARHRRSLQALLVPVQRAAQ